MSYKLQVVSQDLDLNFNTRFENLARSKKPEVIAKNGKGEVVKQVTVYKGAVLKKGDTQKKWMNDKGIEYGKGELQFFQEDTEVSEIEQTKVMNIEGFQPLENYTDTYVIGTYYELSPSDNDMKKDIDRKRARQANLSQMRKLWRHLHESNLVARGEFCPTSRGFLISDGYIRAIKINGNKWGLEIGVFKEEKIFKHLQEGEPQEMVMPTETTKKRIKRI